MRTPQTLAQKIIARAAGVTQANLGEILTCDVDLAMFHDSSGPRRLKPLLDELRQRIWNPDKVALVIDHYVPEADDDARRIVRIAREAAQEWQLPHVFDSVGICHVVVPQRGLLRPGMFCVGGDSHSPTGGAFGAYMFGVGSTEMLSVVITGQIWIQVPTTIELKWNGLLGAGVCAKDMMLHAISQLGINGARYQVVEFTGEAVRALPMQERMTLSNMSAELGAQAGLVAADDTTVAYLRSLGVSESAIGDATSWHTDPGATCECHDFNADDLSPQVAAPFSPANTLPVAAYANVKPTVAYIGACTGAKLDDLRAAASVLKGRRVARGIRLLVAPASQQDQLQAQSEGVMHILTDAGAELLPNTCGACAGYGGAFEEEAVVISSTARNFKARMGPASVQVYLGSPYTVAAAAVAGRIVDPRELLNS